MSAAILATAICIGFLYLCFIIETAVSVIKEKVKR
jgi:hypothetical protein